MLSAAWLFAGQGAQFVGMGLDVAARFSSAARVLEEASAVVDYDLSAVLRSGPEEELARTDICQPATVAVSLAMFEAAREARPERFEGGAGFAAGLSLGEYTALVGAGALSVADALRLVWHRGQYMQEACRINPGKMFSIIGLDDEAVETACEACGPGVWVANYNCPGQVVLSGRPDAAERAAALCKEKGAKMTVELKVAGAFHTELMAPAADRLAADLDGTEIRPPRIPVVSNVSARPVSTPNEIRTLLKKQLTSPVRWTESVRYMIAQGAGQFFEFGPGKVLTGLLKRLDRTVPCTTVNDLAAVEKF